MPRPPSTYDGRTRTGYPTLAAIASATPTRNGTNIPNIPQAQLARAITLAKSGKFTAADDQLVHRLVMVELVDLEAVGALEIGPTHLLNKDLVA